MVSFRSLFERDDQFPEDIDLDEMVFSDTPEMEAETGGDKDEGLAGLRIGVTYCDVNGVRTHRIVRVLHMTGSPPLLYLGVHCELRDAYRTLLASQIESCFDPATGAAIDLGLLTGHSPEAERPTVHLADDEMFDTPTERDPAQSLRAAFGIINALRHELGLLVTVARADRRYRETEMAAILKFAEERAMDRGFTCGDSEREILREWIRVLDPGPDDLVRSVQELSQDADALATIWEVSELVAEADGKITRKERETIRGIRTAIEDQLP